MRLVPDDAVQMISASGTPEECQAKVAEYIAAGATCPILYPLGDDVRAHDRHFRPVRAQQKELNTPDSCSMKRGSSHEELSRPGHPVPQGHGARRVLPDLPGVPTSSGRTPAERRNADLLKQQDPPDRVLPAEHPDPAGHRGGHAPARRPRARLLRRQDDPGRRLLPGVDQGHRPHAGVLRRRHRHAPLPAGRAGRGGQWASVPGHQLRRRLGRAPDPGADRPVHDLAGQGHARRAQGASASATCGCARCTRSSTRCRSSTWRRSSSRRRRCRCCRVQGRARRAQRRSTARPRASRSASREADVIYMEPVVQADYTQSRVEASDGRRAHARPRTRSPASCCATRPRATRSSCTRCRGWTSCRPTSTAPATQRYWVEAFNGVVLRMALLALVLGAAE